MENTNSENKEERTFYKKDLIEKLMKFGNQYEESLAIIIKNKDADKIVNEIMNNKEVITKSTTDILSILKKASQ